MVNVNFGKNEKGENLEYAFKDIHNLLISGGCGSGKTEFLKYITKSIVGRYTKKDVQFAIVEDFSEIKRIVGDEFLLNNKNAFCNDENGALLLFQNIKEIIESRYSLFVKENVKNFLEYRVKNEMPEIVILYDLNSLPNNKDLTELLLYVLEYGNGCGIHIILNNQIIGEEQEKITAFFSSKLCGKVLYESMSKTLLGTSDAVNLRDFWFILKGATWGEFTKCKIDINVLKKGLNY